jgi:hypothetical protein
MLRSYESGGAAWTAEDGSEARGNDASPRNAILVIRLERVASQKEALWKNSATGPIGGHLKGRADRARPLGRGSDGQNASPAPVSRPMPPLSPD